LQESLRGLRSLGFSHALVLDLPGVDLGPCLEALARAAEANPHGAVTIHPPGTRGPWPTRLMLWAASGLRLRDPVARVRAYPLQPIADHYHRVQETGFELELLVKLAWHGHTVVELELEQCPPAARGHTSWSQLPLFLRLISAHWLLPPAFLRLATLQSFRDLTPRERLRESLAELFLREPGSNARIGLSAGLGFFLALTPIWGLQILLTIYLCHRWRLSKTVALLCANISVPPVIPFIMYGSLVLGRVLLGGSPGVQPTSTELAPQDLWPWIVGSLTLATAVGSIGGLAVWILVSLARRLRVAGGA